MKRATALMIVTAGLLWAAPSVGAGEAVSVKAGENSLELAPMAFEGLTKDKRSDDQLKAWWYGKIGESEVDVEVRIFPAKEYYLHEPEDVADYSIYAYRLPERGGDPAFGFQSRELLAGQYGYVPHGALCTGLLPSAKDPTGEVLLLGGILEEHGYVISFTCKPPLGEEQRARVLEYLRKGVKAKSPVQDPKWSKEEVEAGFKLGFPTARDRKKCKKPIRTKHFIVFSNASVGKLFAKKMESFYQAIHMAFPLEETRGRRLLPVYVYRLPEQYYQFCMRVAKYSRSSAEATKGHAYMDYYATYFESPNDPVHIHEATHQIFYNRFHLSGGGSWFQEGLAEYMCTKPGDRKAFAKGAARRNKYKPFREFVCTAELISGDQEANEAYLQAGSIIEFLRDGKFHPKKFMTFVQRMGLAPAGNEAAIELIVKETYGVDIDGLEKEWVKYWKSR